MVKEPLITNDYQVQNGAARKAFLESAEPVAQDVQRLGIQLGQNGIGDLMTMPEARERALPVLANHLERDGYTPWVRAHMARLMAIRAASPYWYRLRDLYLREAEFHPLDAFADALAVSARQEHLEGLQSLFSYRNRGTSRALLIPAVLRVGGDEGRTFVESLRDDPDIGREALAQLQRRRPRNKK